MSHHLATVTTSIFGMKKSDYVFICYYLSYLSNLKFPTTFTISANLIPSIFDTNLGNTKSISFPTKGIVD